MALLPPGVQPLEVIEVIDYIGTTGPSERRLESLSHREKVDPKELTLVLETIKLLGLAKIDDKGIISLTPLGLSCYQQPKKRRQIIRDQLQSVEPFQTATELSEKNAKFSTTDILRELSKKGVYWHSNDETNFEIVHSFLIDWAIGGGLLTYDGRADRFQKAMIKYFFS